MLGLSGGQFQRVGGGGVSGAHVKIVDGLRFTTAELARATTACFEGYLVPLAFDAVAFDGRFHSESLDRAASLLAVDGDDVAGIALVARRGWTTRIAAMAVAPAYRRRGVGRGIMRRAVDDARERGDRRLVLEVIETNAAALALYRAVGLSPRRRLVGYNGAARGDPRGEPPIEVDPVAVAELVTAHGDAPLPWMLAPATLAALAAPAEALALDDAAFAIALPLGRVVVLRAIVVRRESRRRGLGSRLVAALGTRYAGAPLHVPQVVPEECAREFFTSLGFERDALTQFEMEMTL